MNEKRDLPGNTLAHGSILSFPDRGPWGNSRYRGNCSGRGLDLHSGFNILKTSILATVGKPSDLVLSHPPYYDMIPYSGSEWGREGELHPDDLSRCGSETEFLEKLRVAIVNQRKATVPGGFYGIIIGDVRRCGQYSCYQADAVLIKAQHNIVIEQHREDGAIAAPLERLCARRIE